MGTVRYVTMRADMEGEEGEGRVEEGGEERGRGMRREIREEKKG